MKFFKKLEIGKNRTLWVAIYERAGGPWGWKTDSTEGRFKVQYSWYELLLGKIVVALQMERRLG